MTTSSSSQISLETGLALISALPLSKPEEAEQQLLDLLDTLIADPPAPDILFQILEQAREPLYYIREFAAQTFQQTAPHLNEEEEARFRRGTSTWQKIATAYSLCLPPGGIGVPDPGHPQRQGRTATLLHRCLYHTGMLMLDHYRAKHELPAGTWLQFHRYYATAEELGVAEIAIDDMLLDQSGAANCKAIYVVHLLLEIALPYSRDNRDLGLIWRWAAQAARQVEILPTADNGKPPSYLLMLEQDLPLQPGTRALALQKQSRALDTGGLTGRIALALEELERGIIPDWLGIGETGAVDCRRLLRQLHATWSLAADQRRYRRLPGSGVAQVCTGFNAMHYFILQTNPESSPALPNAGEIRIDYRTEPWQVENESPDGFRLGSATATLRPINGQLLAFLPHDGECFLLARTSWVKREQEGRLVIGLAVLPGIPRAIGFHVESRIKGQPPMRARAFLLPPVPAMKTPATLVLPTGTFSSDRRLTLEGSELGPVTLMELVQRGVDFERVTFRQVFT